MDVIGVETEESRATDVVDLDSKLEIAVLRYAVNPPRDLDPMKPCLQCKFIKWDASFSFSMCYHKSQMEMVKSLHVFESKFGEAIKVIQYMLLRA